MFITTEESDPIPEVRKNRLWDRLTVILGALTGISLAALVWIYLNPRAPINPFPPREIPAVVTLPTPLPTETPVPTRRPNRTPNYAVTKTASARGTPTKPYLTVTAAKFTTITPTVSPTEIILNLPGVTLSAGGSITPTPTVANSEYPYELQPGSPNVIPSSYMKPESSCNWMGIGGKVVDLQGSPIVGLIVRVYGFLDGKVIQINSATSTGTVFGDGGYEITLANRPVPSHQRVWVQLSNLEGAILSDKTYVNTPGTCEKNLIIINFRQVR